MASLPDREKMLKFNKVRMFQKNQSINSLMQKLNEMTMHKQYFPYKKS